MELQVSFLQCNILQASVRLSALHVYFAKSMFGKLRLTMKTLWSERVWWCKRDFQLFSLASSKCQSLCFCLAVCRMLAQRCASNTLSAVQTSLLLALEPMSFQQQDLSNTALSSP